MAKKVDAEALLKQRFWITLGLLVPLVITVMFLLSHWFPEEIKKKNGAIVATHAAIHSATENPKNKNWLSALEERYNKSTNKKNEIWEEAWRSQEPFLTDWPDGMPEDVKTKKIWSPFSEESREKFASDLYYPQLADIERLPQPEGSREEVVQFKGGWQNVLTLVSFRSQQPESEEIWLAQEDLWLQKELLRLVRDANELAGTLKPVPPLTAEEKKADGTFANPVWRMSVKVSSVPGKILLDGKLTNVSPRREMLGVHFRVHFPGGLTPEEIAVEGEPLLPGESIKFQNTLKVLPEHVERVTQLFNWRTAPIKRIDALVLGARSSPIAEQGLRKPPEMVGDQTKTASGVVRDRYLEVQGPVRRVPFGLGLVIEEPYLQDVLSAFANSRLRVVVTQTSWQHFRDFIRPPVKSVSGDVALAEALKRSGKGAGGEKRGAGGRMRRAGSEDGGGGEPANSGPAPVSGPSGPGPDERVTDLLEVAIYGTATLYKPYAPEDTPLLPKGAAPGAKK